MNTDFKKNNHFFLDRSLVDTLPPAIAGFIQGQGLLSSVNGLRTSFCGLVSYQGQNYFFFPRQSNLEQIRSAPINYCALLIQALLKFAQHSRTQISSPEEGADATGFDKLEMFKYLINDFQQHGIFKNEELFLRKNSGKTDWKKTLNRSVSYPDISDTPVFLDVYGNKRTSTSNEITRIHADILVQVYSGYGFLFTTRNTIPYSLKQYGTSLLPVESQISLLKNEIRNHFSDRHTILLKTLIEYLLKYKGNKQNNEVIGVTRFHVAWEHMLAHNFNNVIDINTRLPKPVFINKDGYPEVAKKSGMRTDIVIEDKKMKQLAILDAKYYNATTVDNAPGWADLVKQFFYEKALAELPEFTGYLIQNGMIFPGKEKVFKSIKMQDQHTLSDLDKSFPPIHCLYLDPMEVLENYVRIKKTNYFISTVT